MHTSSFENHYASKGASLLKCYVLIALFIFSTSPKPFLIGGNLNAVLIGFMVFSLSLIWTHKVPRPHLYLYFFLSTIVFFPPLINPESVRWSTVFYSLLFSFSFIAYDNILRKSKIQVDQIEKAVRILLLSFFCLLLIQQICVLMGLPVLFASQYSAIYPWKLNTLSAEPSWAARSMGMLMFAYILLHEIRTTERYSFNKYLQKDIYVWLGFLWSMLTMQSATAIPFLMLVFWKTLSGKFLGVALVLIIVAAESGLLGSSIGFNRLFSILEALISLDYLAVVEADRSGSIRIAPLLILAENVEFFTVAGLFGNGIDSVSSVLSLYIIGLPEGFTAGGMMIVWYEYGFLSFLSFCLFSISSSGAVRSISNFILWLMIVFLGGINIQYVWGYLMLATSVEYFRRQAEIRNLGCRTALNSPVTTAAVLN